MAKQSTAVKIDPDPLTLKPFYLLTPDDYDAHDVWRQQVVAATMTPDRRAEMRREAEQAVLARQERVANAWPVLAPGTKVKADVTGWRTDDCQVAEDLGPASDGSRKITVEKIAREQRITVRRDRVMEAVTALHGQKPVTG